MRGASQFVCKIFLNLTLNSMYNNNNTATRRLYLRKIGTSNILYLSHSLYLLLCNYQLLISFYNLPNTLNNVNKAMIKAIIVNKVLNEAIQNSRTFLCALVIISLIPNILTSKSILFIYAYILYELSFHIHKWGKFHLQILSLWDQPQM